MNIKSFTLGFQRILCDLVILNDEKYKNNDDPLCARAIFQLGFSGHQIMYAMFDNHKEKRKKHNLESGDSLLKRITKF